ncbi:unnamed protein product [Caenorhabditis nigoni]
MDANLRINMSIRMPSIRAIEKAVPLKMRCLSFSDTSVKINDVCYELNVYRDYPNGDVLPAGNDFDRFGFEIPFGSSPILPGDVSFRNGDEQVVRTDTDELEERYQTQLTRCEILLRIIAEKEAGITPEWDKSWNAWTPEFRGLSKEQLQYRANHAREKLKPFHCRRHNLPRPFNCYIQLSTMEDGEAKSLQKLTYTRKLYEAAKQFNHILFANRPVIRVNRLVFHSSDVYRIPAGMKTSANELSVEQSQLASIARILNGDVNTLRVLTWKYGENWWHHRLVKNAKELTTGDSPLFEKSSLMLKTFGNKIIRFKILKFLTTEQYCELIENWMSVKRETGAELWISFRFKRCSENVPKMIQTRMEVIRKDERCVRILGEKGTQIEVLCVDDPTFHGSRTKVKIIKN